MNSLVRSYINIGAIALVLIINFLSNAIPFNGLTQTDISELYPVLLTPAGYVFSIWILIYVLLIGFTVYQAMPKYRENEYVTTVGILFTVTSILNIAWLFFWHYLQIGVSLIIMLLLLATLIYIYLRLDKKEKGSSLDWLLVKLPFSLYLAWITVATLANFNVWLNHIGWLGESGFGAILFTVLMIIIGAIIAIYVFYRDWNFAFALVFVWAFIGIGVRHGAEVSTITLFAWAAAVAIIFFLGWVAARKQAILQ